MNSVVLVGRLTNDVELRYTQNGVAVGNFTLAVNRPYTNQNGERDSDFIRCTIWRKPAENLAQYQKKGDRIAVRGSIETGSYKNEQGQTVYTTQVRADEVEFLSPVKQPNQNWQQNQQQQNQYPPQKQQHNPVEPLNISDQDLPF